ncbi:hypothetical protein GTA08_BOTSDO12641 [Botryosphaeria dothidea]|uniref:DUF7924 domain-containing protein n=1 Tax=Botryosphaeria dothidea TaxID=55169 RepID=A0A8H4J0C8_9PEZI|nr:hypothetical protein GTA08_BOTSDO14021 [Botryosphaeria dothidea]KAF4311896.1 hypothetical protein GTA08_BOTSDO12641 [Botryosphaeria dothidea]
MHGLSTELEVVTERDWLPELKPEPWTVFVPVLVPQKRPSAPLPSTDPPALPLSRLTFELKTPRPDIFVAFSESSFSSSSLLDPLQAGGTLFSDPTTSLGVRFPFLLIETKPAATGGSLYHAQNQAAAGGACMLNALKRLGELSQLQGDGSPPTSLASTPMAFSILSSSSLVEVWIHYWNSLGTASTPHSSCLAKLAVFDCTMGDGCESFLRMLSGIIRWGVRELEMWCNETLDTIAASSAG